MAKIDPILRKNLLFLRISHYLCNMKVIFEDTNLEELIRTGHNHKYKKYARDKKFLRALLDLYETLEAVDFAEELKMYSRYKYEPLKYGLSGKYSLRIMPKRVERLIVVEKEDGSVIIILELDETHYGNKH